MMDKFKCEECGEEYESVVELGYCDDCFEAMDEGDDEEDEE